MKSWVRLQIEQVTFLYNTRFIETWHCFLNYYKALGSGASKASTLIAWNKCLSHIWEQNWGEVIVNNANKITSEKDLYRKADMREIHCVAAAAGMAKNIWGINCQELIESKFTFWRERKIH